MKKALLITLLFAIQIAFSQDKGTVKGKITDKDLGGEPLPFANVIIKGTSIGSTTDMDGNYTIPSPSGQQTIVFSFIGYETIEKTYTVAPGKTVTINQEMGASEGEQLAEIEIKTTVNREKESALLLDQKKATVIKESIGAQMLAKTGVSNAAAATSKIAGVAKSEGSGNVYIRGLGDRYLFTTFNGLTIPSDDIDKKNINLDLFPSRIIQSLSISKTYNSSSYVDQSSGHIDIGSKEYSKKGTKLSLSTGANTNAANKFSNFKRSRNQENTTFGFYSRDLSQENALTQESWNTTKDAPINHNISFSTQNKISLGGEDLKVFFAASHGKSFSYREGLFRQFNENTLDVNYEDAERFTTKINTSALLNLSYKINSSKFRFVSLFMNSNKDDVYEFGRNKQGFQFDQEPSEYGSFVRDQNAKQTTIYINQLIATHKLTDKNKLSWAVGYNIVNAKEPNRIRNEVNFGLNDGLLDLIESNSLYTDFATNFPLSNSDVVSSADAIEFSAVSSYQQRKSSQSIKDKEINGYIKDDINIISKENNEGDVTQKLDVEFGVNSRYRTRDFESFFYGVRARNLQIPVENIDNLTFAFTQDNLDNRSISIPNPLEDFYNGEIIALAGFTNITYKVNNFFAVAGLRYESDSYNVSWDTSNAADGELNEVFTSFSPSLSLKQELTDKSAIRLIGSITTSLPEIKELAPFQYQYPTGRVVTGNPALQPSTNYNFDLKYELFPTREQLFSVTAFYKSILDPINFTIRPGAAANFFYENTGEEAQVYGIELEGKVKLFDIEDTSSLKLNFNTTLMDHIQDLKANYQYGNVTETKLAGASNFIVNAGLIFNTKNENELSAALTGNYTSDIVYALGAPRDQSNKETLYNDQIIEKGFATMNLTLNKKLNDKISIGANFKNLLNPEIKQTQDVLNINTGEVITYDVASYKRGIDLSFSFSYNF